MARVEGAKNARVTWSQPASMAPGVPTNIALGGGVSAGTTLATPGVRLRISANVAVQYRVGAGAQAAVATDNDLPANTPEYITLENDHDSIAFFSAVAGTAKVAVCSGPVS